MKTKLFYFALLVVCHCFCAVSFANSGAEASFCRVTSDDGLGGETVNHILKDHFGRIWLSTNDGISLYDGKRVINFKLRRTDSPNPVYMLSESDKHIIYAATRQGIFKKDAKEDEFHLIYNNIQSAEAILPQGKVLYIGTLKGLYVCDGKKNRLITVEKTKADRANSVRDIKTDNKGNVWFLTRDALNCYYPSSGSFKSYKLIGNMPAGASLGCFVKSGKRFFIGTKHNGLYVYNIDNHKLNHVTSIGNVVTSVSLSPNGCICVSADGDGAYQLDLKTMNVVKRFYATNTAGSFPSNAVRYYFHDSNNIDWFGFYRYGLSYTYHVTPVFRPYSSKAFTTEGMNIQYAYIDGNIRIISSLTGLYYIDEATGKFHHFSSSDLGGSHYVWTISYFQGKYYIGTEDAGLRVLDPAKLTIYSTPHFGILSKASIRSMSISPEGELWVGSPEGIFVIDKQSGVRRLADSKIGTVRGFCFEPGGNVWISTDKLLYYDVKTRQFRPDTSFPKGFFNLTNNLVVAPGHANIIYFYSQNKVFYSDFSMSHYGQCRLPEGLREGNIYAFCDDNQGSLWIATGKGLFRTNYHFADLQLFGEGEGLASGFINGMGIKTDSRGQLWLCTSNGLQILDRKSLASCHKHESSLLSLYSIRAGSSLLDLKKEDAVNSSSTIYIGWNILSEKLTFKALLRDYAKPNGRLYQYSIDGKGWHTFADGVEVNLPRLFLGKHALCVRLLGESGTNHTFNVVVLPSWASIIELICAVIAVILLLLWYRYHHDTRVLLNERDDIEEALIEVERKQQEDEERLFGTQDIKEEDSQYTQKYTRVKIDDKEFEDIANRMRTYVEQSRSYTNPDFKMSDLADALGLSPSKLSQVFNIHLNQNYYEFINQYRLDMFKRLIAEGQYKKFTLTALSEQCGFKKSNFFSTFRRVEGMTPMEYLKKQNIRL